MAFMSSERRDKGEELMSQEVGRSLPTPVIISFFKATFHPHGRVLRRGERKAWVGSDLCRHTEKQRERDRDKQTDRPAGGWLWIPDQYVSSQWPVLHRPVSQYRIAPLPRKISPADNLLTKICSARRPLGRDGFLSINCWPGKRLFRGKGRAENGETVDGAVDNLIRG